MPDGEQQEPIELGLLIGEKKFEIKVLDPTTCSSKCDYHRITLCYLFKKKLGKIPDTPNDYTFRCQECLDAEIEKEFKEPDEDED